MTRLTLGIAYYQNPGMLAQQFRVWAAYPVALKAQIEAIVVDDSSPEPAAHVPRPAGLPKLTIGRLADVADPRTPPWRQDAARNRAAHEAAGEWLFLTDMDHVLPSESLEYIFDHCLDGPDVVYTFQRLDAPNLTPKLDTHGLPHPHPNTYLLTKRRYWAIGGYDESCGGVYGTDGPFRAALLQQSTIVHLDRVPIVRYARDVIADASTRTDRQAFKRPVRVRVPPAVLSVPYRQQVSA